MMRCELHGRLLLIGVDPEHVAELLELPPDFFWRRGDAVPNAPMARRHEDVWGIESRTPADASLDAHVQDLATRLDPVRNRLRRIDGVSTRVIVAVWSIGGARPELVLAPSTVHRLAELDAEFAIDLYVVRNLPPRTGASESGLQD